MSHLSLNQPFTMRSGLTIPNRMVKAAMAERLADEDDLPGSAAFLRLYRQWAEGGWGLVITGNVEVDPKYLGSFGDVAFNEDVDPEKQLLVWKRWAEASTRNGTKAIVQINHPAPSAVPIRIGDGLLASLLRTLIFGTPREMTVAEIEDVVRRFAATAKLAADAGFHGVEIHGAHGYLLTQFMSAKSNLRTDAYGGTVAKRAKIVVDIINAMRAVVPEGFCIGIKLNSVDFQSKSEFEDCKEQLRIIASAGVDFVEISGGTAENPSMMIGVEDNTMSDRTKAREAFFLEFAEEIRKDFPDVPLMVTGGFRTRYGMEAAVGKGSCDLVGIARPSILAPQMPKNVILNPDIQPDNAVVPVPRAPIPWYLDFGIKAVGAGAEGQLYGAKLKELSSEK